MGSTVNHILEQGGGASNSISVSLGGNTFTVGQWIHKNVSTYGLADSGDEATSEPLVGVVTTAGDPSFTVTSEGEATVPAHGFAVGSALYLDATGTVTVTAPTSGVYKQVGYVKDANTIFVRIGDTLVLGGDAVYAFQEYSMTGDGIAVNFDFPTDIAGKAAVYVTVGGVPQSISAYNVVADGNGDPRRIQFTEAPADGLKIVARYLGIAKAVDPVSTVNATDYNSGTPVPLALTSQTAMDQIQAASNFVFAHGLGQIPKDVRVVLRCLGSEFGYSIGDELSLENFLTAGGIDYRPIATVTEDTSNIEVVFHRGATTGIRTLDKTTGNETTNLDLSKWGVVVYANAEMAGSVGVIQAVNTPATEFESAEILLTTLTAGSNQNIAHGLGQKPKSIRAVLVCKTAENGFQINDEVPIESTWNDNGVAGDDEGSPWYTIKSDSTNISITRAADGGNIGLIGFATNTQANLNNANWAVKFYANKELGGYKGDRGPAGTGKIAQVKRHERTDFASGTTQIPLDDTIPLNSEGDEFFSLSFTPKNPDSTLIFNLNGFIIFGPGSGTVALFKDSENEAFFAAEVGNLSGEFLGVSFPANGTSTRTYKVRLGQPSAGSGQAINGNIGGRNYGGVSKTTFSVTEILP